MKLKQFFWLRLKTAKHNLHPKRISHVFIDPRLKCFIKSENNAQRLLWVGSKCPWKIKMLWKGKTFPTLIDFSTCLSIHWIRIAESPGNTNVAVHRFQLSQDSNIFKKSNQVLNFYRFLVKTTQKVWEKHSKNSSSPPSHPNSPNVLQQGFSTLLTWWTSNKDPKFPQTT